MNQFENQSGGPQCGITRREMLTSAAVTGSLAALSSTVAQEPSASDSGFIDGHVHVWTPDTKTYPLDQQYDISAMQPASFTPEQLFQLADPCGVRRVVLIQMSFYGFDNSYMLDAIKNHPGRFSGVAVINPENRPTETMKTLKAKGVRGFRIVSGNKEPQSWLNSDGMKQMWECAADESMAICPLINPQYLDSIHAMCERYPQTTVVIDHFARIGIDGTIRPSELDALCRLAQWKNVHVKTSAFYALGKKAAPYTDLGKMIHTLAHAFGSERLMWATDCPYQVQGGHTYHESIDLIRTQLDFLTDADRSWILGKTAAKVFFN